jgi:hypothetical protein
LVWFGWGARRREDGLSSGSAELLLLAALSRKGRGRRLSSWISLLASAFGGRDGERERGRQEEGTRGETERLTPFSLSSCVACLAWMHFTPPTPTARGRFWMHKCKLSYLRSCTVFSMGLYLLFLNSSYFTSITLSVLHIVYFKLSANVPSFFKLKLFHHY